MTGLRIVRLANFITPRSGGLRTALRELGEGYVAAGHEPVLVMPGSSFSDTANAQGRIITLPGPVLPGLGGYRVLLDRHSVGRQLAALRPDRLEVSDRTTLRWTGAWARRHRVPSVMVSHESVAGLLRVGALPDRARGAVAARLNRRSAANYDRIVCTTGWAAREFEGAGVTNVVQVPLGVDLDRFHPRHRAGGADAATAVVLVCATRMSLEKRPYRALMTLRGLLRAGVRARLVMAGDGPLRAGLMRQAEGLPVTFTGWIDDRAELARLQANADVVLAPGPIETFGLAALEALACGTPVVCSAASALPDVIGSAGAAADGDDLSAAVLEILRRPAAARRAAARARAEQFGWIRAVRGFLDVHEGLI